MFRFVLADCSSPFMGFDSGFQQILEQPYPRQYIRHPVVCANMPADLVALIPPPMIMGKVGLCLSASFRKTEMVSFIVLNAAVILKIEREQALQIAARDGYIELAKIPNNDRKFAEATY